MKVLFIDDDLITTQWVAIFLKSNNIKVKTADSISTAMECLRNWIPDVIVSDLSLQGEHAFSLIDYLARNDGTAKIPVIAMTGHELEGSERQKVHGYLRKPVDPEDLLKLIREVMPGV